MTYRIILAGSLAEGNAYARSQDFKPGRFRVASRAGVIKGLRVGEVHELASFAQRLDRHAVLGVLRYARVPAWYYIDAETWPLADPEEPEIEDGAAPEAPVEPSTPLPDLPYDTTATVSTEGAEPVEVETGNEPVFAPADAPNTSGAVAIKPAAYAGRPDGSF